MLLSDFLKTRNSGISVTTGNGVNNIPKENEAPARNEEGLTFAEALTEKIQQKGGVEFSSHAIKRIESRNIDVSINDRLDRLNKGVELAAEKGSSDTLILVDSTAFIVNVKNNKVITTMTQEDLKQNVFTNIDSTVIM